MKKAENKEQAKELIANAGMELTDEEMNMVSGGQSWISSESAQEANRYKIIKGVAQIQRQKDGPPRIVCNGPEEKLWFG
ncbi:MAG: hypothetical protein IJJ13_08550 [Lachnospiraceae bacterium]|nr:hypothetical protein [Lachnospiraceae bacterium]